MSVPVLEVKESKVGYGKDKRTIRYIFFPCPYEKVCQRCYLDDTNCFFHCQTHRQSRSRPDEALIAQARRLLGLPPEEVPHVARRDHPNNR